jgi:large subunit ribosomal protein L25
MKQVSLSGSPRENVGRKGAEELRKSGRIPGVIYGGPKQVPVSIKRNDWDKIASRPDTLQINLDVNGQTYQTIVQEIQMHPVTDPRNSYRSSRADCRKANQNNTSSAYHWCF